MTRSAMAITKLVPLGAIAVLPLLPFPIDPAPAPLEPHRDIATLLPARSLFYVEGPALPDLLEEGLAGERARLLLDSELARMVFADAGQSPADLLAIGEGVLGAPVLPTLAALTRRGVALAVAPLGAGREPGYVVVAHGDDELLLEETVQTLFRYIEKQYDASGAFASPHNTVRGADVFYLGEDATIALRESLFVMSNDEGLVRDVLDLAASPDARGLAADARFQAARAKRADDDLLWACADLGGLERVADGALDGLNTIRSLPSNPAALAILGPGITALGSADVLSASLGFRGRDVELALRGDGAEGATFLRPGGEGARGGTTAALRGATPNVGCAEAIVYRDFATLFQRRVELFPAEQLPGFAKAINDLALFFGGRDLGEDVLPGLSPWLRVVSRPLDFGEGRTPEVELPGLAVVAGLEDPARGGEEFTAAFQSLMSIINVDRAQEGMMPMTLRLQLEGDVQITSSRFPLPGPDDGVDLTYNLEPACAVVGDCLIAGTHISLVRELVRELVALEDQSVALPAPAERLTAHGGAIAQYIERNFDALVMTEMLENGTDLATERASVAGFQALVAWFERATLDVTWTAPDAVEVRLEARLAAPEGR